MKERQPLILQPFKLSDPKESLEYLESFLRSSNEEEIVDYCLKNYQGAMCDYDYYEASIMWYKYKQVFEFDATTFHEITIADKIKEILADVLEAIPFPSIYLWLPKGAMGLNDGDVDGIVVYKSNNTITFCLFTTNITVKTYVFSLMATIGEMAETVGLDETMSEILVQILFRLLLYVCTTNADVCTETVYRKSTKAKGASRKNPDRKPYKVWKCGFRYGIALQKQQSERVQSVATGTGAEKKPHSRRGHYHHFWVGKRDSEERKLILKWVNPTYIHSELVFDNQAIVHKVKG